MHSKINDCLLITLFILAVGSSAQRNSRISPNNEFDVSTSKGFCLKYKCICPEPQQAIKCSFPAAQRSVDFTDPSVSTIDFSNNSLQMFVFGDTTLNVKRLILSRNRIQTIYENMFVKMPHLTHLDLAENQISSMQAVAFQNLNLLEFLNVSRAFDSSFRLTNEFSSLVNLRVLDLSYANLEAFSLERFKVSHLTELHMRYTQNADSSASNWLPFVGTSVRSLDLTGSNLRTIDIGLAVGTLSLSLTHLSVDSCTSLDKANLVAFLKTNRLVSQLKSLNVANLAANSANLPIESLILNVSSSNLEFLNVSSNSFTTDLNVFLFDQVSLKNLQTFDGSNNKFKKCNRKLVVDKDATLLTRLTYLDLSHNLLDDSSCLGSIRPVKTLRHLDMSHNYLKMSEDDFKVDDMGLFFANKINMSYIDFSYNQLTFLALYFNPYHVRIENFDLSHNSLKKFHILSFTKIESDKHPFDLSFDSKQFGEKHSTSFPSSSSSRSSNSSRLIDLDENEDEEDEAYDLNDTYYDEDEEYETVIATHNRKDMDDDKRFIFIEILDLSHNQFETVNMQHMLQSVQNVVVLDLSFNPIFQVVGVSVNDPDIIHPTSNSTLPTINKNPTDENSIKEEVLCIDNVFLNNCRIKRMPNLQHTCINKLDMSYNLLNDSIHLFLSKYTVYFMDYLNLQANNISYIKLITTDQKYKQDAYAVQNSPMNYFYGRINVTTPNHTVIDLKANKNFRCDCKLVRLLFNFQSIRIVSEKCSTFLENPANLKLIDGQCRRFDNATTSRGKTGVNRNLKLLFAFTCLGLIALSLVIIYYSCSDCLTSWNNSAQRVLYRFFNFKNSLGAKFGVETSGGGGGGAANLHNINNIGVQYSKLVNDATASQIELNS